VDVRSVAATHRDLAARVATGEFREDLLYRLNVVTIPLPPVRHRRDDIPALVEHFLRESRTRHPEALTTRISGEAMAHVVRYGWPGNVRELAHFVERAVLLGKRPILELDELPASMTAVRAAPVDFGSAVLPLREMQRRYVAWAYEQLGARKLVTAERLGIDDKTLARWLSREA
jgi:two-component system response regulator HydG